MKPLLLALTLAATPGLADDLIFFHSPSRNINCLLASGDYPAARCDMGQMTPSFTNRPTDCDLDWGQAFEITPGTRKGHLLCFGDTVVDMHSLELGYGASVTLGDLTCTSQKTGMTCTNTQGHGFTLAKARQTLF